MGRAARRYKVASWACVLALSLPLACSKPKAPEPEEATERGDPDPTSKPEQPAVEPPRLVVLLVVDQMRADYLQRFRPLWTDGFVRLLDGGAVWSDMHHDHAITYTAAGHATLTTGVHPARHGMISNAYIDRSSWEVVGISDDPKANVVGAEEGTAQSAHRLRRTALGDWLREASPESKTFAFAVKGRAAICAGGQRPHGVFWHDPDAGKIISSSYYVDALPAWLESYNAALDAEALLADGWTRALEPARYDAFGPDAVPNEADGKNNVFPHTLEGLLALDGGSHHRALRWTPHGDEVTFDVAEALLREEKLGQDDHPDFLIVSVSPSDYVGHRYGPDSHETADHYARLDAQIGDFLRALDSTVGEGHWTLALTSDHGVMPIPETVEGGKRLGRDDIEPLIDGAVEKIAKAMPELKETKPRYFDGIYLEFPAGSSDEDQIRFRAELAKALEASPWIEQAYTRDELADGEPVDATAKMFAHTSDGERTADLLLHLAPHHLISGSTGGTNHGTAYAHDSHVPFVLFGPGIPAGQHDAKTRTVDVAPTLASILNVPVPDDLDGRTLAAGARR